MSCKRTDAYTTCTSAQETLEGPLNLQGKGLVTNRSLGVTSSRPDQHRIIIKAMTHLGGKNPTVTFGEKRKNAEKLLCRGLTKPFTLRSEPHLTCEYSL